MPATFLYRYVNMVLRIHANSHRPGGFSEHARDVLPCRPSSYTETNIRSASGRKGQFDYSFGLSYADTNQSETIGGSRNDSNTADGTSTSTSGQTTITVSETKRGSHLDERAKNAVTTLQAAKSSFTVPPARLRFRGYGLGLSDLWRIARHSERSFLPRATWAWSATTQVQNAGDYARGYPGECRETLGRFGCDRGLLRAPGPNRPG